MLHEAGLIPLPPYIKREPEAADKTRYQTVYANADGSVAAPTAGLHFTHHVLKEIQDKKIQTAYVTLHVGAGTFKPVKSETIGEHDMHAEFIEVKKEVIEMLRDAAASSQSRTQSVKPASIIAVGTTSFRTIESLYWMGVKLIQYPDILPGELALMQWEAYQLEVTGATTTEALGTLLSWMDKYDLSILTAKTQLLVVPGYTLRLVNILVTNFHQPQSTLLLLMAAVAGPKWKEIYDYALDHDFRFLSYGDGCLIKASHQMTL